MISSLANDNIFIFKDNVIVSCSTCGLYVQGLKSKPIILHNVFYVCKSTGIIINSLVDGFIGMNQMQICEVGIEIINNSSHVFENNIQKSHVEGMKIRCTDESFPANPII